jgi:predicted acetyltransferase
MLTLQATSLTPPAGLEALIADLGGGANGFGALPVFSGESTLDEYLAKCVREAAGDVTAGRVPQTTFWALEPSGEVVGMVRMRHCLNEALVEHGGHIGYFVRSDRRGRGYAKEILALTLRELRKLGETRALLTTDEDNAASIAVILANGGVRDRDGVESAAGGPSLRFWIEL